MHALADGRGQRQSFVTSLTTADRPAVVLDVVQDAVRCNVKATMMICNSCTTLFHPNPQAVINLCRTLCPAYNRSAALVALHRPLNVG
jgi:hypothetical protein